MRKDTLIFALKQGDIDIEGLMEVSFFQFRLEIITEIQETKIFMFAGHDTTMSTLSFALSYITEDKLISNRCRSEIEAVCCASGTLDMSSENLKKLKYLEACIKETLRLRPPVREWIRAGAGKILDINGKNYHTSPEIWFQLAL